MGFFFWGGAYRKKTRGGSRCRILMSSTVPIIGKFIRAAIEGPISTQKAKTTVFSIFMPTKFFFLWSDLQQDFGVKCNHWLGSSDWEVFMGGELSKGQWVLFLGWPFGSKRNDSLQLFLPEYRFNMNFKTTINLFDVGSKRCFVKFFFHFEEVLLVLSVCTCVLRARAPSKFPILHPWRFCLLSHPSCCGHWFWSYQPGAFTPPPPSRRPPYPTSKWRVVNTPLNWDMGQYTITHDIIHFIRSVIGCKVFMGCQHVVCLFSTERFWCWTGCCSISTSFSFLAQPWGEYKLRSPT